MCLEQARLCPTELCGCCPPASLSGPQGGLKSRRKDAGVQRPTVLLQVLCTALYRDLRVLQMITAYTYSGLSEPAQRECGTWQGMGHLVTAHLDHPPT